MEKFKTLLEGDPSTATSKKEVLYKITTDRIRCLGLVRWRLEILSALENAFALDKEARQFTPENMWAIYSKIEHSEQIEAISLLKQALGKAAVCSGDSVIIPNVLPFWGEVRKNRLCRQGRLEFRPEYQA